MCCLVVHVLWCHSTNFLLIYLVQQSCISSCLCLGVFGGVAEREMQALDIPLSFWCTQPLLPSIKTSQGQWSYSRITEQLKRFTNAVGAAILKHKAKHSPTHIASHKNEISCFSPLSHCLAKQTILGSNGTVAFPWGSLGVFVGQKLTEQTKCPWVLLLLLCPGSSLHPQVVPGSLDCPRQMGSIWPTISSCSWADPWWLFPSVI